MVSHLLKNFMLIKTQKIETKFGGVEMTAQPELLPDYLHAVQQIKIGNVTLHVTLNDVIKDIQVFVFLNNLKISNDYPCEEWIEKQIEYAKTNGKKWYHNFILKPSNNGGYNIGLAKLIKNTLIDEIRKDFFNKIKNTDRNLAGLPKLMENAKNNERYKVMKDFVWSV